MRPSAAVVVFPGSNCDEDAAYAWRQAVGGDPDAAKQLEQITRQMRLLDPKRFPGNPALVEQMHRDLLGSVDRLELQLQRNAQTDARTGKPDAIPAGYQEQVADYYRRLSKK